MNFLVIVCFIFLGSILKKVQWIHSAHAERLNQYVIYICLPAIILLNIPQLNIDYNLLLPAMMAWLLLPFLVIFILLLGKNYHWPDQTVGCLLLIVCFGNTSFVGFPIIQAFYGDENLVYAVIYDQIGTFLSLAIVANIIIAKYSTEGHAGKNNSEQLYSDSAKTIYKIVKRVVLFPPFIALLVSFFIHGVVFVDWISSILSIIAMSLVPVTMLLVGYHFKLKIPSNLRIPLFWGLGSKMIFTPILCVVFIFLYKEEPFAWLSDPLINEKSQNLSNIFKVSLMESAMPPMVTASIMAIHAKLAPKLAAAAVGYGLLFAIVIMPLTYLISSVLY